MTRHALNDGVLAPVEEERELVDLKVTGNLPQDLRGMLLRNGPNPFSGRFQGDDVLSWWPEAAMLHGLRFEDGRACSYRNRWLRTKAWAEHFGEAGDDWLDTNPNVNVVCHAGQTLALAEGGVPMRIDASLASLGPSAKHAALARGVTAHPKIDPVTGEMIYFHADWAPPFLTYGVLDADGEVRVQQEIELDAPVMMHDFAVTASHAVFLDLNVGYDLSMFEAGYRIPIRWIEERASRLGVIARGGGPVRWFDIAPCFIQHVINAYDDGERVVVDAVRYPYYFRASDGAFASNPLGVAWRYVIDLARGTVSERQLDDRHVELPRIDERRSCHRHRYFYAVAQPSDTEMRGIVKHDLDGASVQEHAVRPGDQNSEPVFVACPGGVDEDDGWLLVCVYDHVTDSTRVRVLDARDMSAPVVAEVDLGVRVPGGFHGAWVPSELLTAASIP